MTPRMRRLTSDWEQVQKDFSGHKNIVVEPLEGDPPEKYRVTYFINGIYLLPDGRIETLSKHVAEITLQAEYPRYKPLCRILTPIWHPNFRDGQICIGDIWGAGESLTDIIINIGDMIQYKSWNSYSPLSSDAAAWAMENRHLFPVGTVDLYKAQPDAQEDPAFDIDLIEKEPVQQMISCIPDTAQAAADPVEAVMSGAAGSGLQFPGIEKEIPAAQAFTKPPAGPPIQYSQVVAAPVPIIHAQRLNDFEFSTEDLADVEFIPAAQRMQGASRIIKGRRINFKTIFMKGVLYGLIGGLVGWLITELIGINHDGRILSWMGYTMTGLSNDYNSGVKSYNEVLVILGFETIIESALFSGILGGFIGAVLGLGEGIYYGSRQKAVKYALMGFGIALGIGLVGGFISQMLFSALLGNTSDTTPEIYIALIRAVCWAVMGAGAGLAVGLIKPEKMRIINCAIGGLAGGFLGGFLFDFVSGAVTIGKNDTGVFGRAVGITLMGLLIGLGIGLLEQFAKAAWLKVVRGEFEGKEYIVFAGTTSIGNNSRNTIVLFKDKLVAMNHCDIVLEGNRYVLVDKGSPLGTLVNGIHVSRHVLRRGDAIAVGNSILIFNTR